MNEIKQIESALNIAANRGCFNLQDSAILFSSLRALEAKIKDLEGGKQDVEAKSIGGGGIKNPKP